MAKKKYQFGDPNYPKAKMKDFSGNLPNKDILNFLLSPGGQGIIDQYKKAGYSIKANDYDVTASRPTGEYKVPPQVEAFNALAQLTTGIANKASDIRSGRREYQQYLQSLQPVSSENFDEQGLNNLPVYYKYGGDKWIPHNLKKGRCTPLGNPDCPPGSPQYKLAVTFKKHHGFHEAAYGGEYGQDAYTCQHGCGEVSPDIHEMMKAGGWIKGAIKHPGRCAHPGDANCPEGSPQYNLAMRFKHGDLHQAVYGYKAGGWIQGAIQHPGRCAHPGDSNCPEGSPQYNLAMRFKHGDLHKSQYGSQAWSDANQEAKRFAIEKGLMIGEDAHIGNSIPQYIDSRTGKPNIPTSVPSSNPFINKFVPSEIGPEDLSFNSALNLSQYIDPQSGDIKYAPANYLQLPRFQKKPQPSQDLLAKYPYGGGPLTSEGAKEILRDGTVHGRPLTSAQKRYFGYIAGGGHPKAKEGIDTDEASAILNSGTVKGNKLTAKQRKLFELVQRGKSVDAARKQLAQFGDESDMNDTPAIEAEEGEVYQTPQGQLNKISDQAPTHEDGGVVIDNASRVLENTSSIRDDKKSKHLLLSPQVATLLTGTPIKKPVSHAEAMDMAHEHISDNVNAVQNKMKRNVKDLENNAKDKFAQNSLDFNLLNLAGQQKPNDVFDSLFKHQEAVKAVHDIENPKTKAQTGIDNAQRIHDTTNWEFLYQKGNKQYFRRPDGTVTASTGPKMSNQDWEQFLQSESPEHKAQRLANQNPGYKYAYAQPQSPGVDLTYPTAKMADIAVSPQPFPIDIPNDTTGTSLEDTNPIKQQFNFIKSQPKSRFNEPLHWYDVAGPISGLLEGRIPVKYNGAQLNQIRLQQQNPLPALEAGQRDYNAAMWFLPENAQGYANAANLFSKKYGIDNQVIGQYANVNNDIKNREIMYNANVKDRQSMLDQNSRATFEDQRLGSIEAQRLQHRTDWDSLMQTLAQNRALNRNGNLAMQLFPAFDQNAQYNGYRVPFHPPLTFPNENDGLPNNTTVVTNTTASGKKQYFMKTADGKLKPISFR